MITLGCVCGKSVTLERVIGHPAPGGGFNVAYEVRHNGAVTMLGTCGVNETQALTDITEAALAWAAKRPHPANVTPMRQAR